MQHLMRKRKIILSVISSSDSLADLETTMNNAVKKRLAHFYDKEEGCQGKRGVHSVIDQYIKEGKSFIKFGICSWSDSKGATRPPQIDLRHFI